MKAKTIYIMKIFNRKILIILLGIILPAGFLSAQQPEVPEKGPELKNEEISKEQLEIMKANRQKQIDFRNAFKETLSEQQLGILNNASLTREQKMESFRKSLSENQAGMIKANRKEIKSQNFALRATLGEGQRMQLRRMAVNRAQMNRILFQRSRLQKGSSRN